jgi:hypothetical protein
MYLAAGIYCTSSSDKGGLLKGRPKETHLVGELARVTQHDGGDLRRGGGLDLLQHAEHEDGCLAHAGLGLAQHVHAQDRLGDALVLHCSASGNTVVTGRRPLRVMLLLLPGMRRCSGRQDGLWAMLC